MMLRTLILCVAMLITPMSALAIQNVPDAGTVIPAEIEVPKEPIPEDRKPTLKLEVSPSKVNIGEVVNWKLTVKHRLTDRVHLGSEASFGSLEVRKKDITNGETSGDWIEEILSVELIGFDPEEVEIPSQKLTIVGEDGRMFEFETDSSAVTVQSLVANEPEPKLKEDLGPGEKVFEKDYTLLWVLGALLSAGVIALLTLLGRWLWAKRKPRPGPPPPPPRPAHEIALEKLEALEKSNLLADGEIKEFHVCLSEAVREYLGNRYHFDSLELSTEELRAALKQTAIGPEDYRRTTDFLEETDLVKFAKMILTLEASQTHFQRSVEFVHATTPKPVDGKKAGDEKSPAKDTSEAGND